jgi:hypothetical protein
MLTPRVSTVGETLSFTKRVAVGVTRSVNTKSKAIELYSLAKAQEFQLLVKLLVSPRAKLLALLFS